MLNLVPYLLKMRFWFRHLARLCIVAVHSSHIAVGVPGRFPVGSIAMSVGDNILALIGSAGLPHIPSWPQMVDVQVHSTLSLAIKRLCSHAEHTSTKMLRKHAR